MYETVEVSHKNFYICSINFALNTISSVKGEFTKFEKIYLADPMK